MELLHLVSRDASAVLRDTDRTNLACVPRKSRRAQKQMQLVPRPDDTVLARNQLRHKLLARRMVLLRADGRLCEQPVANVARTLEALRAWNARVARRSSSSALVLEHPQRGTLVYAVSPMDGPRGAVPQEHAAWPFLTATQQQQWLA